LWSSSSIVDHYFKFSSKFVKKSFTRRANVISEIVDIITTTFTNLGNKNTNVYNRNIWFTFTSKQLKKRDQRKTWRLLHSKMTLSVCFGTQINKSIFHVLNKLNHIHTVTMYHCLIYVTWCEHAHLSLALYNVTYWLFFHLLHQNCLKYDSTNAFVFSFRSSYLFILIPFR
jgi:hypothetical protein